MTSLPAPTDSRLPVSEMSAPRTTVPPSAKSVESSPKVVAGAAASAYPAPSVAKNPNAKSATAATAAARIDLRTTAGLPSPALVASPVPACD